MGVLIKDKFIRPGAIFGLVLTGVGGVISEGASGSSIDAAAKNNLNNTDSERGIKFTPLGPVEDEIFCWDRVSTHLCKRTVR